VVRYLKGHGTQNDFILLPDPDGLSLTTSLVAALCDRRAGIGADGVLAVVETANDPAFFMDYRNADGSLAEMCGNGIRVFARYLVDSGRAMPGELRIGTRDGVKHVLVPRTGDVTVEMGPVTDLPPAVVGLGSKEWPAIGVSLGNPHLVVRVDDPVDLGPLANLLIHNDDYTAAGANVEFVAVTSPGRLTMRVHERGVGETRSCGTGACAAVAVAAGWTGAREGSFVVDVPGGRLGVELSADRSVRLTGPAVLVAEGELRDDWLEGLR
jgi:diaminopimelate epimerase